MAVIPARGGSKGIAHKNIIMINGKELLVYTLDAAKESKYIDKIIVSTEDDTIGEVARREGVSVLNRPEKLAQDTSKTIDVLIHVIENITESYDYLVLLQPTQPLRKAKHIDEAIEAVVDYDYPSLVSVSPARNHPLLLRQMDLSGHLVSLIQSESTVRRQDFSDYYVVNGAIYINKISDLNRAVSLNDNQYGYFMPAEYDIDIDENMDLVIFEAMLKLDRGGVIRLKIHTCLGMLNVITFISKLLWGIKTEGG